VHPDADEIWYDGVDQDCDGGDDYDADGDGHRAEAHGGDDCDDAEPTAHPGGTETWYDGIDGDCDGADDYDTDGDGHQGPSGSGPDCDDADPFVHPDAEEVCNGVDDDCDGTVDGEDATDAGYWYVDADGDGVGGSMAGPRSCEALGGHAPSSGDCDDGDPAEYPGVVHEYAGYAMTCVGAGGFPYGSPEDEVGRYEHNEDPQSEQILDQAFYVGLFEVTLSQFVAAVGFDPDPYPSCEGDCAVPVGHEVAEYLANQLSTAVGLPECYSCSLGSDGYPGWCESLHADPLDCQGFRLPSEQEWEKAARAGTRSAFSNGGNLLAGDEESCELDVVLDNGVLLDDIGAYCGSDAAIPLPPGTRSPNPWGLFDVHGNLGEWTDGEWFNHTDYSYYFYSRGGFQVSISQYPCYLRSAGRGTAPSSGELGIRFVLSADADRRIF